MVISVATMSSGRFHRVPPTDMPTVARRSMAVKAKLSVLPSFHPRRPKTPTSFDQLLVGADAEAVFQCADAARGNHVGRARRSVGQANGFGVVAHIGVVEVAQQADGALVLVNA